MPASTLSSPRWRLSMAAAIWALIAALLNLLWEVAQLPLYTIASAASATQVAYAVVHCTAGDVILAAASFVVAVLVLGDSEWPASHPAIGGIVVTALGVAYTAVSEWYNVYRAGNWAYAFAMPLIFGIGLAPLAQWLVVPVATLLIMRARLRVHTHETPRAKCS